jgi:hypothetical protein
MLAHGRVVVMMRLGDKKRRSVPSGRDRWCADPVKGKLTAQVNLAVVVIVMTCASVGDGEGEVCAFRAFKVLPIGVP